MRIYSAIFLAVLWSFNIGPVIAKVVGQGFDSQANANIVLFDDRCPDSNLAGSYPFRWEAINASNNSSMGWGCFGVNQQSKQVFITSPGGRVVTKTFADFGQGGGGNVFSAISDGMARAQQYWGSPPPTNLTPGLTGGNSGGVNCSPNGSGGYYCR